MMRLSNAVFIALLLVGCIAVTNLINHAFSFTSFASALQDSPTKEEFEKLKSDVDKIRLDEQANLGRINTVDTRYKAVTDKINNDLTAAEFKFAAVGDIVASALTLDQFIEARKVAKNEKWVQCDGTSYPDSAYAKLAKRPDVPNLQDRYPRGYVGDEKWPLLTKLDDMVGDHTHQLSGWGTMPDAKGGEDDPGKRNQVLRTGYGGDTVTSGVRERHDETRPKTTIVNFFIRIN